VCIIARGEKVLDGTVTGVKSEHHKLNVALSLGGDPSADVAAILSDRALVLKMDDNNRYFEIEMTTGGNPQALLQRLVGAGAQVQRFELIQPSLHQIFLDRVGATGVEEGMSGHG
jgi:ABC-2 type transport system ATP-binding protein